MKEDLVLYHLTKSENSIQSLLIFPPRLKWRDEGAFSWRHDSRFPPKPRLTVDIKIHRTPLMESNFTYVCEHHRLKTGFRVKGSYAREGGGHRCLTDYRGSSVFTFFLLRFTIVTGRLDLGSSPIRFRSLDCPHLYTLNARLRFRPAPNLHSR